jgi:hypothetical protein
MACARDQWTVLNDDREDVVMEGKEDKRWDLRMANLTCLDTGDAVN